MNTIKHLLLATTWLALAAPAHAANTKISEMPDGGSVQTGDTVPVVRDGANYRAQLAAPGDGLVTAAGGTVAASIKEFFGRETWAQDSGAKCDGFELGDVTTTSGSPNISSASRPFIQSDVGKIVYLYHPTTGNAVATTTIASVSSGNATMAGNASSTLTAIARMILIKTDDTVAINAASIRASAKGGGIARLPAGICLVSDSVVPKRNVIIEGAGNATTILLKAGSNVDVVKSENFSTLTGTGLNYGPAAIYNGTQSSPLVPSWFGLGALVIDGNRANQSAASNCVSFYGNAQIIDQVLAQNCHDYQFYTEASPGYAYSRFDRGAQEEGFFGLMIGRNSGSGGWLMRGPHDSVQENFISYDWGNSMDGSWGFRNEISSTYSGAAHFGHIHPYTSAGAKNSVYIGAPSDIRFLYSDFGKTVIAGGNNKIDSVFLLQCGSGGATPCLDLAGGTTNVGQINGSWLTSGLGSGLVMVNVNSEANTVGMFSGSSISSTASNNTMLKVRGNFNKITATPVNASGTGNICADIGGTYNTIDIRSFGCKTHLNYASGNYNSITFQSFVNTGETFWAGSGAGTQDRISITTPSLSQNYLPSLTLTGDMTVKYRTVAASGTLTATDHTVGVNTSGGAYTQTLPTPSAGRLLSVCDVSGNASTNNLTLDAGAGITISGPGGVAQTRTIATNRLCLNLQGTGTSNWIEK